MLLKIRIIAGISVVPGPGADGAGMEGPVSVADDHADQIADAESRFRQRPHASRPIYRNPTGRNRKVTAETGVTNRLFPLSSSTWSKGGAFAYQDSW